METLANYWQIFKKRPDVWFFWAFLAASTLSVRKVLFFYPVNGGFNEYTGVYLYLSDIFLCLTLLAWLYLLNNNISILSRLKTLHTKCSTPASLRRASFASRGGWNIFKEKVLALVPRGTFSWFKQAYQQTVHNYLISFPLILSLFSFVSISWSISKPIALFRSIKLLEFILLYLYIVYNVPRGTFSEEETSKTQPATIKSRDVASISKCSTWNIFRITLFIIISIGSIQAFIGIWQFVTQSSLNLFWLKESLISAQIPGVAKVILNGNVYVRAYGLFPHPNILGGFLVLSIIATLLYIKMFHARPIECSTWNISSGVEHFKRESDRLCSTWNILRDGISAFVPRGTFFPYMLLLLQGAALLLSFSKSAILGLLLGLFYILLQGRLGNVPRPPRFDERLSRVEAGGTFLDAQTTQTTSDKNKKCSTWNIFRSATVQKIWSTLFKMKKAVVEMFHVEHFKRKLLLLGGILILLFLLVKPDTYSLLFKSLQERAFYLHIAETAFLSHPLLGVGSGQFIPSMAQNYLAPNWQYQPVHNVPLLILNEFGIFMLLGFLFFLYKMFHPRRNVPRGTSYGARVEHFPADELLPLETQNVPRGTFSRENNLTPVINTYFKAIFIAFTFIMLFDHYLWDIQPGALLFWLVLGICAGFILAGNKDREVV